MDPRLGFFALLLRGLSWDGVDGSRARFEFGQIWTNGPIYGSNLAAGPRKKAQSEPEFGRRRRQCVVDENGNSGFMLSFDLITASISKLDCNESNPIAMIESTRGSG